MLRGLERPTRQKHQLLIGLALLATACAALLLAPRAVGRPVEVALPLNAKPCADTSDDPKACAAREGCRVAAQNVENGVMMSEQICVEDAGGLARRTKVFSDVDDTLLCSHGTIIVTLPTT